MLHRLAFVAAALALISTPRMVTANPITYNFTGELDQPFDGATTFSGSLTINATPTAGEIQSGGSAVAESGSDVSLMLNFGGHVFNFINSPQNSSTWASISVDERPTDPTGPDVEFMVGGGYSGDNGSGRTTFFGISLYSYGVATIPANLASLTLPVDTSTVVFPAAPPDETRVALTSFEMVSTPEPRALAIFSVLSLAALLRHRRRELRH